MKRIGVLTSGGDSPGMLSLIHIWQPRLYRGAYLFKISADFSVCRYEFVWYTDGRRGYKILEHQRRFHRFAALYLSLIHILILTTVGKSITLVPML